jgi:hypothetical protein
MHPIGIFIQEPGGGDANWFYTDSGFGLFDPFLLSKAKMSSLVFVSGFDFETEFAPNFELPSLGSGAAWVAVSGGSSYFSLEERLRDLVLTSALTTRHFFAFGLKPLGIRAAIHKTFQKRLDKSKATPKYIKKFLKSLPILSPMHPDWLLFEEGDLNGLDFDIASFVGASNAPRGSSQPAILAQWNVSGVLPKTSKEASKSAKVWLEKIGLPTIPYSPDQRRRLRKAHRNLAEQVRLNSPALEREDGEVEQGVNFQSSKTHHTGT